MGDGDDGGRPPKRLKEEQPDSVKKETTPDQLEDANSLSPAAHHQSLPLKCETAQLGASSFPSDPSANTESPPNGISALHREAAQTVPKPV
jgi:hypothetical protein